MVEIDLIDMEVLRNYLEYSAEEMGIALRNSAYSPNIKERMDHSCAIFDRDGRLLAQAEHIPVHLGSMPISVKTAIAEFDSLGEGDIVILNDPYRGGTHLPDITLVSPVYYRGELLGYVANRAHHSDVGGKTAGSMAGDAVEIFEEGLIIPPIKLFEEGELNEGVMDLILANTRTPEVRKGDIFAQVAAVNRGISMVKDIARKYGVERYIKLSNLILDYTEKLAKKRLNRIRDGEATAVDYLDDDGIEDTPVKIVARVSKTIDEIVFDFTGSEKQRKGPINAPFAVTLSASYYVLKSLLGDDLPTNEGAYRPLKVIAPEGTIVNAKPPAPVSAGNVETSQRIVDVLLKALHKLVPGRVPAASQGTMNNVIIGGYDPYRQRYFTFYETVGGGAGASLGKDGESAVHTHMTNTMNTPIEEIERAYPIMIMRYEIREGSGGEGKWRGGDGIIREYKLLTDARVTLIGDRQKFPPYGLEGGESGARGEYRITTPKGETIKLKSKTTLYLEKGTIITIETPGGGGYGKKEIKRVG